MGRGMDGDFAGGPVRIIGQVRGQEGYSQLTLEVVPLLDKWLVRSNTNWARSASREQAEHAQPAENKPSALRTSTVLS